jgi:hypothetical protein
VASVIRTTAFAEPAVSSGRASMRTVPMPFPDCTLVTLPAIDAGASGIFGADVRHAAAMAISNNDFLSIRAPRLQRTWWISIIRIRPDAVLHPAGRAAS